MHAGISLTAPKPAEQPAAAAGSAPAATTSEQGAAVAGAGAEAAAGEAPKAATPAAAAGGFGGFAAAKPFSFGFNSGGGFGGFGGAKAAGAASHFCIPCAICSMSIACMPCRWMLASLGHRHICRHVHVAVAQLLVSPRLFLQQTLHLLHRSTTSALGERLPAAEPAMWLRALQLQCRSGPAARVPESPCQQAPLAHSC